MRVFAFYLPQFYPTPENNEQWGKGFTEWTSVTRARPLYEGHQQPNLPTELGFYDLRVPENIATQIDYADEVGIDGFAYWHYWFGDGEMTLEKPARVLLENKDLRKNFYFTWVNCIWTKQWVGDDTVVFDQIYGVEDYKKHFDYLLPFFMDERYEKVDGKPVFAVNHVSDLPSVEFFEVFNDLAIEHGFPGIFWLGGYDDLDANFLRQIDFLYGYPPGDVWPLLTDRRKVGLFGKLKKSSEPRQYDYNEYREKELQVMASCSDFHPFVPVFMANWDNTPRYGENGFVFEGQNDENLFAAASDVLTIGKRNDAPFVLCKAWNEWAEGNVIEPCSATGRMVGDALGRAIRVARDES